MKDNKIYKLIYSYKKIFDKITKLSLNYSINFNPILIDVAKNDLEIFNNTTNQYETGTFIFIGLEDKNIFTWYDPFRLYLQPSAKKMISSYLGSNNKKYVNDLSSLFDKHSIEFDKKYKEIIPYMISLFIGGGEVIRVKVKNKSAYFSAQIPSFELPSKIYEERNKLILQLRK